MSDCIEINGLRVVARHGVLEEEQSRAQPFEIDVRLVADLATAGESDSLADTVDYGAVSEAIASLATNESYALIERLAQRIADVCLSFAGVVSVEVTVKKLRPPVAVDVQSTSVTIVRP
ncbi:MAG: dihydroneopterin aldolase [Acidimicrobiia bacterium]